MSDGGRIPHSAESQVPRAMASPSQTVGPFFHFGLATNAALGRMAGDADAGERIRLRVRVLDGDGVPVPDALVELYQADASGNYPPPEGSRPDQVAFSGFGRLPTDSEGRCVFETVKPGPSRRNGTALAPYITVCLFARGLLRHLHTRIYFAGDTGLDDDPILALVPADRRGTLIAARDPGTAGTWEFVIRLQGQGETVFFDI